MLRRSLLSIGLSFVALGVSALLFGLNQDASTQSSPSESSYVGWGMLLLGLLTLASNHYLKLREARRQDRAEARLATADSATENGRKED